MSPIGSIDTTVVQPYRPTSCSSVHGTILTSLQPTIGCSLATTVFLSYKQAADFDPYLSGPNQCAHIAPYIFCTHLSTLG